MKNTLFVFLLLWGCIHTASAQDELLTGTGRIYRGITTGVGAVAINADGSLVAAGGKAELLVWNSETSSVMHRLHQNTSNVHPEGVIALAFTPDGKHLISAGGFRRTESIRVWNIATGRPVSTSLSHEGVNWIGFHPNGRMFITAGLDGNIRLWTWNGNSDFSLTETYNFKSYVEKSQFVADMAIEYSDIQGSSNLYFVCAPDNTRLYSLGSQTLSGRNQEQYPQEIRAIAASDRAGQAFLAMADGRIYRGKDIWTKEPYAEPSRLAVSNSKEWLAVVNRQTGLSLWHIAQARRLQNLPGHTQEIKSIAFSTDNQWLVSGGLDNQVRRWQVQANNKRLLELAVEEKMNRWLLRDQFEKSAEYQARVADENQQKQLHTFTEESLQMMGKKASLGWRVRERTYDSDNETYRFLGFGKEPIYVKVSPENARKIDRSPQRLMWKNERYTLNADGDIVLQHADFTHPDVAQVLVYDRQSEYTFNPAQDLSLKLNGVDLGDKFTTDPARNNNKDKPLARGGTAEVDYNLPKTKMQNPDAIAVVIGNAVYQKTKNVDFAIRDARSIRSYLTDVMGYRPANIIYLENASYTDFKLVFGSKENPQGKLYNMVKPAKSDVFVFYSGHGAPGLNDKKAYFVPSECDPQYVELTGFETDVFYDNLAKIPARSVVVAIDACFSGENIYQNISPIVIKSKGALGLKDGALLASSQPDQVSGWYNEKGHGLFTYFFLKAIHNQNADQNKDKKLTLQEIYNYISDQAEGIPYQARRLHGIRQEPVLKGQNTDRTLVEY